MENEKNDANDQQDVDESCADVECKKPRQLENNQD
jgi:hypothetical protein